MGRKFFVRKIKINQDQVYLKTWSWFIIIQLIDDDHLCLNLQPLISGSLPAENHPSSISCGHQRPSWLGVHIQPHHPDCTLLSQRALK